MIGALYRFCLVRRILFLFSSSILRFSANTAMETIAAENINARTEKALDSYGNNILRLAYSYFHNMEDAEDILQDTLIKYLESAPVFENSSHEKSWLLKTAANLSKNRIKYNKIRLSEELDENITAPENSDLSFVWEAVKQLPETQCEVVHLFYQEGYQTADIAKILGRKEATVRSDLKRARERLKSILREAYDFE